MSRDLFRNMKQSEGEKTENKEYTQPEEKSGEIEITNRLLDYYISERDDGILDLWMRKDFESLTQTLESIVKNAGDKVNTQVLIDSLTVMLRDESNRRNFTMTEYLTALVQALFNLDYSSEFVIDIRSWPENRSGVGGRLKIRPSSLSTSSLSIRTYAAAVKAGCWLEGRADKPLILNLYGKLEWCGDKAKYCDFTFYEGVKWCGVNAENCTFSLMPNAYMKNYFASIFKGNKQRRMNEDGEWEIVSPIWLKAYHKIMSIFR